MKTPQTTHTDPASSITVESPIGPLTIVAHETAVTAIHWQRGDDGDVVDARPVAPGEHRVLDAAVEQLREYFAGTRTDFDLPLDPQGTPFQRTAWDALARIPFGETVSYGEQARMLGDANKSRAVGSANGKNPIPIVIPCHRVVGSKGQLTGFAGGLETKAWLLDHEFRVRASV